MSPTPQLVLMLTVAGLMLGVTAARASADVYIYDKYASAEESPDGWNLWLTYDIGGSPQLSPHAGVNPALDASGGRIAYADWDGYYVGSAHTPATTQILSSPAGCVFLTQAQPQWTPDGLGVLTDSSCDIQLNRDLADHWESQTLISWPGRQMAPSMSPDGTKLAFLSNSTPAGDYVSTGNPDRYAVFVTSASGANPVQITTADSSDPDAVFPFTASFSPDGSAVAFEGYDNDGVGGSDSEIYTVSLAAHQVQQLTEDNEQEWGADWLADGRIAFAAGDARQYAGQFHAINPDGTEQTNLSPYFNDDHYVGAISGRQPTTGGGSGAGGGEGGGLPPGVTSSEVLERYAPALRYDAQETFFADSAAEMTDFAGPPAFCSTEGLFGALSLAYACVMPNDLKHSDGSVVAGHAGDSETLNLDFLGSDYASDCKACDYVDAEQSTDVGYSFAANTMREDPELGPSYANKTYGRVRATSNHIWLQYWLFYYDNPFEPAFGEGEHEGDWEMIQLGLDPNTLDPDLAVYSQHHGGEKCVWDQVPKEQVTVFDSSSGWKVWDIPAVYVGAGSHANYFSAGTEEIPVVGEPESHNGNLLPAHPGVIDITDPPDWLFWPGTWGSTRATGIPGPNLPGKPDSIGSDSPPGPRFHSQWSDPDGFAQEADGCSVETSGSGAAEASSTSAVPAPTQLSASGQGSKVVVTYRLASSVLQLVHPRILLTVQGTGTGDTPIGGMFDAASATGSIPLPLPVGDAPYVVRASIFTAKGARSEIVSAPVQDSG